MKTNKKSLRGPILAVVFLLAVFLAVRWFVVTKRGPGSMTVVEAQAMDMTAMKAPIGVFPVGTDHALVRKVGGTETFPATIVALSDEDVVARVDGLLKEVFVYPGDRVKRGQLLARLQADELSSEALAESLAAQAMESSARRATQSLSQEKSAVRRAEYEVESAQSAIETAKSDLAAAEADVEVSREMVEENEAMRKEAAALLTYARVDYDREKKLFDAGAVSRDSLDQAKRNLDEAQAKVDQADARKRRSQSELGAMAAKRNSAANMVRQAESMYRAAVASLEEARAGVLGATDEAAAMRSQAASARANARATGALSSYTEMRATDEGVVTERLVSPGTPVMAGDTVLKLKADRELRIQAELPQRLAGSVTVGTALRATVNEKSLDAKVTSVFPYVEGGTRSFRIEARIANPGFAIQAGSFAEVEVVTSTPVSALSVRREALKTAGDGTYYVWVLKVGEKVDDKDAIYTCTMHPQIQQKGPGICPICKMDLVPKDATGNVKVEKRVVKVGTRDSRHVAILDGLQEGEEVTAFGDEELFPGAAVKVVEWGLDGPAEAVEGSGESGHDHEGEPIAPEQTEPGRKSTMKGHEGHIHGPDDKFTCPMHPEVHKPTMGICPICKMDLVPIVDEEKP
jgi:multidrug efflux pump subunit AcrA (membrane-fusion protein)